MYVVFSKSISFLVLVGAHGERRSSSIMEVWGDAPSGVQGPLAQGLKL